MEMPRPPLRQLQQTANCGSEFSVSALDRKGTAAVLRWNRNKSGGQRTYIVALPPTLPADARGPLAHTHCVQHKFRNCAQGTRGYQRWHGDSTGRVNREHGLGTRLARLE